MQQLIRAWGWFSRLSLVLRAWAALQVALPLFVATWAGVEGLSADLPKAAVVAYGALAFGGALLCVTQLRALLNVPLVVRLDEKLEYGLAYQNIFLHFPPGGPHHGIQVSIDLVNAARTAIRYEVVRFDVVIGNTTMTAKTFTNRGTVIPLGGTRGYRDAMMPAQLVAGLLGSSHPGTLEAEILYGKAGHSMTRKYRVKLALTVHLTIVSNGIAGILLEESDEPVFESYKD